MDDVELPDVETAVQAALATADDSSLTVLGYGEISLVVGWPTGAPTVACKRLPPFPDRLAAQRYGALFHDYLDLLTARGVDPVPSRFQVLDASGESIAYVLQPVLAPGTLGPELLAANSPDPDHRLVQGIVAATIRTCDTTTGLDAQVSNWTLDAGRLQYLDVTTPMLFDDKGHPTMDMRVFLAAYPAPLRRVIGRFVAPGVVGSYRLPRKVLVDCAANLLKERLDSWVPAVIEAANRVVSPVITPEEVRRYYRSDARLWEAMLKLRRADRWWQRTVRRRPYPFLLPGSIER